MHTNINTHSYSHLYIYIHIHIHIHVYTYTYTYTYAYHTHGDVGTKSEYMGRSFFLSLKKVCFSVMGRHFSFLILSSSPLSANEG